MMSIRSWLFIRAHNFFFFFRIGQILSFFLFPFVRLYLASLRLWITTVEVTNRWFIQPATHLVCLSSTRSTKSNISNTEYVHVSVSERVISPSWCGKVEMRNVCICVQRSYLRAVYTLTQQWLKSSSLTFRWNWPHYSWEVQSVRINIT